MGFWSADNGVSPVLWLLINSVVYGAWSAEKCVEISINYVIKYTTKYWYLQMWSALAHFLGRRCLRCSRCPDGPSSLLPSCALTAAARNRPLTTTWSWYTTQYHWVLLARKAGVVQANTLANFYLAKRPLLWPDYSFYRLNGSEQVYCHNHMCGTNEINSHINKHEVNSLLLYIITISNHDCHHFHSYYHYHYYN